MRSIPENFTEHEIETIEARLENMDLGEWEWVGTRNYSPYALQIELDPVTEFAEPISQAPDWVWEYESDRPFWPQVVHCHSYGEAMALLDRVEQRKEPLRTAKIIEAIALIDREGLMNAVYDYTDEYKDELPIEADGAPEWLEINGYRNWNDAWCVTTVGLSTAYYLRSLIPEPEEPGILFCTLTTQNDDQEVEIGRALDAAGIEEGSIEAIVARQHLCTGTGGFRAENAYTNWPLIAGVWLMAIPENLELLKRAASTRDFESYYEDGDRAIEDWLHSARESDPETYDEYMEDLAECDQDLWNWVLAHE